MFKNKPLLKDFKFLRNNTNTTKKGSNNGSEALTRIRCYKGKRIPKESEFLGVKRVD